MSVVYMEDASIKIGGVILPGIYKNVEVDAEATVEEQEIEGNPVKPKQAVGYEDAKIMIDLELWDGENQTKEDKLQIIQDIFRQAGQSKPEAKEIVSTHSRIRNIDRVILKKMTTKTSNKKDVITVSLELWEYIPIVVSAAQSTTVTVSVADSSQDYQTDTAAGKAVGRTVYGKNAKGTINWSAALADLKDVKTKFTAYTKEKGQSSLTKHKS